MLKMSCTFAIFRPDSPTVTLHYDSTVAQSYHRLDGDTHSLFQHCPITTFTVIRNLRIFMHFLPYAMPYEFTHDSIGIGLTMLLYGITDVAQTFAMHSILYAGIQGFFGYFQQLTDIIRNLTYTKRISRITTKSVHICATINRHDITLFQHHIPRYAMHNLLVYRCAYGRRERLALRIGEALESRHRPMIPDELFSHLVKFLGRYSRLDKLGYFSQCPAYKQITLAEQFYFIFCFKKNHSLQKD